jgi:hypothetical protein
MDNKKVISSLPEIPGSLDPGVLECWSIKKALWKSNRDSNLKGSDG